MRVGQDYASWPTLPDMFPRSFPGVKTSRDSFVVAIQESDLEKRIKDYLDPGITHEQMRRRYPDVMRDTQRFVAEQTRDYLRHCQENKGKLVRYAYRAFDMRWLYWDADTKLLDEKRADFFPQVFKPNLLIEARQRESLSEYSRGCSREYLGGQLRQWAEQFLPALFQTRRNSVQNRGRA